MENTFEFIEFSHLCFELQCQGRTLSIQPGSSELLLHQIGRWNISVITIICVLVWNNEIGPWVKTLFAINIAPLLKNDRIDLGYLKLFYTLSLNKSSSVEDPGWILKTFCTYFQSAARNGGSCCFCPCKKKRIYLTVIWSVALSQVVEKTDISQADRGYKAIHWVTCLLNIHYSSTQENNISFTFSSAEMQLWK